MEENGLGVFVEEESELEKKINDWYERQAWFHRLNSGTKAIVFLVATVLCAMIVSFIVEVILHIIPLALILFVGCIVGAWLILKTVFDAENS